MKRISALAGLIICLGIALVGGTQSAQAAPGEMKTYVVVFAGDYAVDGTYAVESTYAVVCTYAVSGVYAVDGNYAVGCDYAVSGTYAVYAVAREYAVYAVGLAGGTVVSDLFKQIGVLIVQSPSPTFADVMSSYAVVQEVGSDYSWPGIPSSVPVPVGDGDGGGEVGLDALEHLQWGLQRIDGAEARKIQAGRRAVTVGILDTGIDGAHPDFQNVAGSPLLGTNVDCAKGRNSVSFVVSGGPGVGVDEPCIDNHVHGTHVAGIVGAQKNGVGIVGVAPNVTLVPVKVCDSSGHCYASAAIDAITYAGDQQFNVINMSFYVDDDEFFASTEMKCNNDSEQRAFRQGVERAVSYARSRGVTPVAALGNSRRDLAAEQCKVVPAQAPGVTGVAALGPRNQKASYSNWGDGAVNVAAPGGAGTTGDPTTTILSAVPGGWASLQGTSMASPHAAGVAALIVSQFGKTGTDGRVALVPGQVQSILQGTAVDQGLPGYDECFGHGRINALRAVQRSTTSVYDAEAPFCPEYDQ